MAPNHIVFFSGMQLSQYVYSAFLKSFGNVREMLLLIQSIIQSKQTSV